MTRQSTNSSLFVATEMKDDYIFKMKFLCYCLKFYLWWFWMSTILTAFIDKIHITILFRMRNYHRLLALFNLFLWERTKKRIHSCDKPKSVMVCKNDYINFIRLLHCNEMSSCLLFISLLKISSQFSCIFYISSDYTFMS